MTNWIKEFEADYAVPREIQNLVALGLLEDESWRNNTSPHFTHCGLEIWVEHPDPTKRMIFDPEAESSCPRFMVQSFPDEHDLREGNTLYEGDSVTEALRAMGFTRSEWMHMVVPPLYPMATLEPRKCWERDLLSQLIEKLVQLEQLDDVQEYVRRKTELGRRLVDLGREQFEDATRALQNDLDKREAR